MLEQEVPRIKAQIFPDEPFPIELRFSDRVVNDLLSDCHEVARLKHTLDVYDLFLVTINGFVMPHFHGERVKERVYLPAWHESEARVRFTNSCVDLLAQLAPLSMEGEAPAEPLPGDTNSARREARPPEPLLSVSVPFGALKPVPLDAIAPNIRKCAEHAAQVKQRTGVRCVVALEPEPGLNVETTAEAIEFFQRHVPDHLRPYLGVNFDLSHQLVQFEDLADSVARLQAAGVLIAKVHVSNAAAMTELQPFYDDSIYLHQTCGADTAGQRAWFSLDWPTEPPPPGLTRYRCHYHLPVCEMPEQKVGTTLREVEHFLRHTLPSIPPSIPAIVETYTWPQQLRSRDRLVENICRELAWVRERTAHQ